uniref:Uncharacterized protein n=1 Tax=viral metagenome TaxID=1070528 RepID=A0A6C0KDW2_9ZZZZ
MDNQFNTLMRSYHDNYLQYKLTGNPKYQIAYEAAEKGLDSIILSKNKQVESDTQNIQNTIGADAENKMKDVKSQSVHLGQGLVDEHDAEVASEMRLSTPVQTPSTPIFQYVAIGIMVATIVALSVV